MMYIAPRVTIAIWPSSEHCRTSVEELEGESLISVEEIKLIAALFGRRRDHGLSHEKVTGHVKC